MNKILHWGILGPGSIARSLADDIQLVEGSELTAVASRSRERSQAFAKEYGISNIYDSYHDLAHSDRVDIVYVATPHHLHAEHAILCMEQGKAVLCEKPMTVNSNECKRMIDCAQANGVFLMEGMWTRFFPASRQVLKLLRDEEIGQLRMIQAANSFRADWNPNSRLLNPELAGGGLLDVGCYPLSYAFMCMQDMPVSVCGHAHIGESGVDEQASISMSFPGGRLAMIACGVRTQMRGTAYLYGTDGMIEIPHFWHADHLIIHHEDERIQQDFSFSGHGFHYEIAHVMECIHKGLLQSPIMPLFETQALIGVYDQLRIQWGLEYPFEIA